MPKGVKIPGAGRPKGSKNRKTSEVKAIINSVLPPRERYKLLAELSRGVTVSKTTVNKASGIETNKVYNEKPDVVALKFLSEMCDGKAVQNVDLTSQGKAFAVSVLYSKDDPKEEKKG